MNKKTTSSIESKTSFCDAPVLLNRLFSVKFDDSACGNHRARNFFRRCGQCAGSYVAIRIVTDRCIGFANRFADMLVLRQSAGVEAAVRVEGSASFHLATAVLV